MKINLGDMRHRILLEDGFGISLTRYITHGLGDLTDERRAELQRCLERIEADEPVQQVVGKARFCGRMFRVTRDVLIPRPETEDLVQCIIEREASLAAGKGVMCANNPCLRILDIGTGTGCIAATLALDLPHASVAALDISTAALTVARTNAQALGARVEFIEGDILNSDNSLYDDASFDIIVSNPPYICQSEARDIEANVLEHEPHLALFVPDNDPLLFYRAIAERALSWLRPDGRLYFEVNTLYANDTADILRALHYGDVQCRNDRYGRARIIISNRY